jgi:hypothetical protein
MYAFGVNGLDNWGSLNDPNLSAFIAPALKNYGGTSWNVGTTTRATAVEIFTDFQTTIGQLISQGNGNITTETPMVAILPPTLSNALTTINGFGINVRAMLEESYPKLKIFSGVSQYAVQSAINPQGVLAGNVLQIVAPEVIGQRAVLPAYSERLRAHRLIPEASAFRQKKSAGSWGSVIRMPFCLAQMVGV